MSTSKAPEINIGMIGHVDHGKTTLTQRLTGKWTDQHSEELKRGISIRLGYADAGIYKCPSCDEPKCYSANKKCSHCESTCELLRVVSFVDAPGHETLMATMLSGAAIMDGAILVIAADEVCPQPQTREHLTALEIADTQNIIIVQNKIDLVSEKEALENYKQIQTFIQGTCAQDAPIIPVSAPHDINIDVLIQAMEEYIPTPDRDLQKSPLMYVARSFDINKPGTRPKDLRGGVLGGSLVQGSLKKGDKIEIRPGRRMESEGRSFIEPISAQVSSVMSGGASTGEATPGGLLALGTSLDPAFVKSDALSGRVIGRPDQLPPVLDSFRLKMSLLKRVVGTIDETNVEPLRTNEPLMLTVGTATTVGIISEIKGDEVVVKLKMEVCALEDQRIAVSRRIEGKWHLIGYGEIQYLE